MISGIGTDIVDIPRFSRQLADLASNFVAGTFTAAELADSRLRPGPVDAHLAARFAAKEAFVKAWSAGNWGRPTQLPRVDLRENEVVTDDYHRPALALHGAVALACGQLRCHLSLTHDGDAAMAFVVLEAQHHP